MSSFTAPPFSRVDPGSVAAAAFLLVLLLASSCEGGSRPCQEYALPGIVATAADRRSGASLDTAAVLVARDGPYVDSAVVEERGVAWERPGTYQVRVHAPGYQEWVRSPVHVRSDGCHVQTVTVHALLEPAQ
jgi:hypothetical protein